MKKCLLRAAAMALCFCLLCSLSALAEDSFTIDIDMLDLDRLNRDDYVARELTSSAQGIRVLKYISDSSELAAPVRLQIQQVNTGKLLFDKDYGYESHTFDSGVIYLPYADRDVTPCLVTLSVGNYIYAMPFMHKPRTQSSPTISESQADGGWADDGWASDGWDDGWDDGWTSDAPGWE